MTLNNGIDRTTKLLLTCGQLGCILFIVLFLIQGQLRDAYSPLKFPISSLSIGRWGWIQVTNFLISGSLIFLFAIGFRRATPLLKNSLWTSRLFGAVGLGLFGAGLCSSDPVYGYPMSEPIRIAQFTITGHLHDFFSILVFVCLPICCFKMRNRFKEFNNKKWATYTLISVIGMLTCFIIAAVGFKQVSGLVEFAGVFQRLTIIFGFVWLTTLSRFFIKTSIQI
jgi:hypothetical membrane protein